MTAIERAIKDAESVGYDSEYPFVEGNLPISTLRIQNEIQNVAFLAPLFWQALGKARGWANISEIEGGMGWKNVWLLFIEHLAEGKDAESFFADL
jgi:hypothetical protein